MNSVLVWKEKVNVVFNLHNWIYVYKNSYKDVRMVFGGKFPLEAIDIIHFLCYKFFWK